MSVIRNDVCSVSCDGAINELVIIRVFLNQLKSEKSVD